MNKDSSQSKQKGSQPADNTPRGDLKLRMIQPGDYVTGFSLGNSKYTALKTFLRRKACNFHDCDIGKTYVVVDENTPPCVWAYITLMNSTIELEEPHHPDDLNDPYRYPDFPAIKIARLAVDRRCSGKGIGQTLVELAVSIAVDMVMPVVGCRFIVLDSKPNAIEFYEHCGFTLLDTEENKSSPQPLMYIDLHKLNIST